ncbi:hypothetical protein Pcinc_028053 [Petrolisthes cinctipes]|uniref:Uncharacterized protein n=1 Tax=Petrolisthes cinctipes TaxID=88211 RepID=A0AAE1F3W1_PETCI|nr:hypothetical protein Pcinc_028053 [Petrolisthes cinctipes]
MQFLTINSLHVIACPKLSTRTSEVTDQQQQHEIQLDKDTRQHQPGKTTPPIPCPITNQRTLRHTYVTAASSL